MTGPTPSEGSGASTRSPVAELTHSEDADLALRTLEADPSQGRLLQALAAPASDERSAARVSGLLAGGLSADGMQLNGDSSLVHRAGAHVCGRPHLSGHRL